MASNRLHNYLRASRKRMALSQDEVAFLLGVQSGAKVSRYERFARVPGLEAALAYEAIFQKPISELFPRLSQTIAAEVKARARRLVEKKRADLPANIEARKRQALTNIVSR